MFDEEPVTTRLPNGVCASLTVNDNAPVELPEFIVWPPMLLITGAVFESAGAVAVIVFE